MTAYTKEQLLDILGKYELEYGRLPSRRDLRKIGISDDPYYRVFGSFNTAKDAYRSGTEVRAESPLLADSAPRSKKGSYLEQLAQNLSEAELKTILRSSGPASVKPRLIHTPYETGYVKFILVTDTHIGHKKFREDWWYHALDRGAKEDVQFMFHTGDILEGMSTRPGHIYELDQAGFEAQFSRAKQLIGDCPFPVRGIIGNHDCWYLEKADQGTNVGLRLEESLGNFEYLGIHEANVEIENIRFKLWHGNDGSTYAVSYRGQKIVESLDGGDKPHVLLTGHDHKAIFFQTRNVHVIGGGTLCEQTGFMRGKKLAAHRGYWIVEAWSNEHGLVRIRPEWIPFY